MNKLLVTAGAALAAATAGLVWAGPLAAGLAALATVTGGWALLCRAPQPVGDPLDPAFLSQRLATLATSIAILEDDRELNRGLFEVSTELVGCVEEDDARVRFAAAVRRYWDGADADLMVWERGTWRSLGGAAVGEPPVLDHPVQLPSGGDLQDLVLDLSPGVSGRAALLMRQARPQPSVSGRNLTGRLEVAEILRGQLALSLRRVILYGELQALARIDPLTGTHRRWYGESRLKELVDGGDVVAVAMVDIDRFKAVNDGFGHSAGDQVLSAVGGALVSLLRSNDLVCRWGGEEFLVILPDTPPAGAQLVADRLRQAVAALSGLPTSVTVSIGIAACSQDDTPFDLLARADDALYAAKSGGRDRVVLSVSPDSGTLRITSRRTKERTAEIHRT